MKTFAALLAFAAVASAQPFYPFMYNHPMVYTHPMMMKTEDMKKMDEDTAMKMTYSHPLFKTVEMKTDMKVDEESMKKQGLMPVTKYEYKSEHVAPAMYHTMAYNGLPMSYTMPQRVVYTHPVTGLKTYANDQEKSENYAAKGQYRAENDGAVHIAKREADPGLVYSAATPYTYSFNTAAAYHGIYSPYTFGYSGYPFGYTF